MWFDCLLTWYTANHRRFPILVPSELQHNSKPLKTTPRREELCRLQLYAITKVSSTNPLHLVQSDKMLHNPTQLFPHCVNLPNCWEQESFHINFRIHTLHELINRQTVQNLSPKLRINTRKDAFTRLQLSRVVNPIEAGQQSPLKLERSLLAQYHRFCSGKCEVGSLGWL